MTEPIFFTDTDSNNDNNNFCPVKDYTKFDTKTKIYNYSDVSYDEVPSCNDIDNNEDYEDYNGCCIIKDTDPNIKCETYFGSDSHDLGMKYSFPEFEDMIQGVLSKVKHSDMGNAWSQTPTDNSDRDIDNKRSRTPTRRSSWNSKNSSSPQAQ